MTITNRDDIINALGNNSQDLVWDKLTVTGQASNAFTSLWIVGGKPTAGVTPTSVSAPTKATQGAAQFTNPTSPAKTYLMWHSFNGLSGTSFEIHDRLAHMGGLDGTLTSAQTVNLDISALGISADRIGATDYSDCQWWLECYSALGATSRNLTVNVTFTDATTANLGIIVIPSSLGASRTIPIFNYLTGSDAGKIIKIVNSVTLSGTTGTAGNFGVTVTKRVTQLSSTNTTKYEIYDWARLGMPRIPDNSCLYGIVYSTASTTGTVRGLGKLSQG